MSKKISFFILLIALVSVIFAIAVSAETITYNGNEIEVTRFAPAEEIIAGTGEITLSNMASKLGHNANAQALVMDDNSFVVIQDSTGKLHAFPSYYVLWLTTGSNYVAVYETNYNFINAYSDATFEGGNTKEGNILYIEFPEGLTHVRDNGVWGRTKGYYEKKTTEIVIPTTVVEIASDSLATNTTLKSVRFKEGSQLKTIADGSFNNCTSLTTFEFEKLTMLETIDGFYGCSALVVDVLDFSKSTSLVEIGSNCFGSNGGTSNPQIGSVIFPDSLKYIRQDSFYGTGLSGSINIPKNIEEIGANAFAKTGISGTLDFKGTKIKTIGSYAFQNCTSITGGLDFSGTPLESIGSSAFYKTALNGELNFSGTSLTSIGGEAFYQTSVTKITLPDTLQTIGNSTFYGCTYAYFASDRMPSSLTAIGSHFMSGSKNINNTLIFPAGLTVISEEFFNNTTTPNAKGTLTLVFLGQMTSMTINGSSYAGWAEKVVLYFAENTISDFNGNVYYFTDKETGALGSSTAQSGGVLTKIKPSNSSPSNTSQVQSNHMVLLFCGANKKVETSYMLSPNGTNITEDRGTFVMNGHTHYTVSKENCNPGSACIVCDEVQYAPHEKGEMSSITYPNGFAKDGNINHLCLVCKNEYADATIDAIFIPHGYAYKLNGTSEGISVKFEINKDSRDLFESINGCELHYGVIVANKTHFADGDFIQNGAINTTNNKGLQVEIVDDDFAFFSCLISGFESGDFNALELVMAGYAYTTKGEEKSSVSYFQKEYVPDNDDTTDDIPYSSTITRNEITLNAVTIVKVKAFHIYEESKEK